MARYTRTPVTSGFEVQSQLNQNFTDIQEAIDDTLSRVGDQPNYMLADLDMNSKRIYNLPAATSATEPVIYSQWITGASSVEVNGFYKWVATATASQVLFSGITPSFVVGVNNIDVYVNGVYQYPSAYTETSSSSITFSSGLDAGDEVLVSIKAVSTADTISSFARVEKKTATASQSVFNLTTLSYNIGANNLSVYVNGLRMIVGTDYAETNSTTVTFVNPLALNDDVVFVTGEVVNGAVSTNASQVTYQPVSTASIRTTAEKLYDFVSVKDFGATGDGVTDDSASFTLAFSVGKLVFVPSGTYLLNYVSIPANTKIVGSGATSVIKPYLSSIRSALVVDSGSSSLTIDNISISGLKFLGDVQASGFDEQKHLISINGAKNLSIKECSFIGFRGDGIYIGSGDLGGQERHNTKITVSDCYFDGITKENRNGISIIDGTDVLISGCYFTRCTKSTMPGAIDIEPDANVFHVVRSVRIKDNYFMDIGGNVAVIGVYFPGVSYSTPPRDIVIEDNFIIAASANGISFNYGIGGGITDSSEDHCVEIHGNTVIAANRGFSVFNLKTGSVKDNQFLSCPADSLVSYNAGENVLNLIVKDNLFYKNGSTSGSGLSLFKCSRVSITGNEFNDCGTGVPGSANAIDFNTGTSSYISIKDNRFVSPTAKTLIALQKEAGHTFTSSTNQFRGNVLSGLTNSFSAEDSDTTDVSYTPEVAGATSAGTGTYTTQFGSYTREGKRVTFKAKVAVSAGHTGTGDILVTLPYVAASTPSNEETALSLLASGVSSTGSQVGLINPAQTSGGKGTVRLLMSQTGTAAGITIPAGAFTVYVSGSYLTT
jgi:hypothetical protein